MIAATPRCKRGDLAIIVGAEINGTLMEPHEAIGRIVRLSAPHLVQGVSLWSLRRPLRVEINSDKVIDGRQVAAGSVIEVMAVYENALHPIQAPGLKQTDSQPLHQRIRAVRRFALAVRLGKHTQRQVRGATAQPSAGAYRV